MSEFFNNVLAKLHAKGAEKGYHKMFTGGHVVYFGAVAIGAHDVYALAGGFLLVMLIVGYLLHIGGEL